MHSISLLITHIILTMHITCVVSIYMLSHICVSHIAVYQACALLSRSHPYICQNLQDFILHG